MNFINKFLLGALTLYPSAAAAQSMHAIVFCDTNDGKIGQAMMVDHDKAIREISNMACYIDYDIFVSDYHGDDCNKSNLLSAISDLEVESDDIVVFFYSGHGARAFNNEEDPFPQMCLGSNIDSEWVPLQYAVNRMAEKNPRLLVAIANCCNMETPGVTVKPLLSQMAGATSMADVDKEAMKKLFCQSKGRAVITSSQPGQYSWCNTSDGGLFTSDIFDTFLLVGEGTVTPDWESVFSAAKAKTSSREIRTSEPPYKAEQIPYYAINDGAIPKVKDKSKDRPYDGTRDDERKKKDTGGENDNDALLHAINSLVDGSIAKDVRLKSIPGMLRDYFAPGAKVRTLGRNGMTVDYENAADFLRRVALSRRIARITVLDVVGDSKKTEISVHEIHK